MQIMGNTQVITGGRVFSFSFPASFFCEAFSDDTNQYLRVRVLSSYVLPYLFCFQIEKYSLLFQLSVCVSTLYSKPKASWGQGYYLV